MCALIKYSRWFMVGMSFIVFEQATLAADVTVNYIGEVIQSTCVIEGGTVTVTLPPISLNDVLAVSSKGGITQARGENNIVIKSCPPLTKIELKGISDPNDANSLKNVATTNAAQGVGVAIWFRGSRVSPNYITEEFTLQQNQPTALNIVGHTTRTADIVTAGKILAVLEMTMKYK